MSTISVSDLQKKPAKQWLKSAGKDDLVVTSKGQPVAVLLRIASASVESTRALLRSVRALQAQASLQQAAATSGAAEFSMSDIDAEIAASRRARRRKRKSCSTPTLSCRACFSLKGIPRKFSRSL
jgi:PHD/YefM family antitoxin component YafN of YafNO toxin-antitoxin module